MNLYRMSMGGSDIEPYIVIVTLDENFQGQIVTLAQDTETMSKTVPMTAPYEVTFKPMKDGVWVASSTTKDGKVVSVNTEPLLEWGTYNVTLKSGLNFQEWLNRGRVEKTFTSLDDVLADQPTVRQLMTVHASCDYLYECYLTDNTILDTIMNSTYGAKWLGLRDYVCDKFMSNETAKATMLSSSNWEYILKDNVPIMTSNTAPYGELIGGEYSGDAWVPWHVFDGDSNTGWATPANKTTNIPIGYKFNNPICIKALYIENITISGLTDRGLKDFKIQYSDDNDTWNDAYSDTLASEESKLFVFSNAGYHIYWRLLCVNNHGAEYICIYTLQFYGRSLNVSVPTMTSDSAPWGIVTATDYYKDVSTSYDPWRAFANGTERGWLPANFNDELVYDFGYPVLVKKMTLRNAKQASTETSKVYYDLFGSIDGQNYDLIQNDVNCYTHKNDLFTYSINTNKYRFYKLVCTKNDNGRATSGYGCILQLYGLDYSEREFAEDSKIEYIYDHGVKLKTIETSISNGGTIDEQSDQILWSTNNKNGVTMLGAKVDITGKKVARARFGLQAYTNASDKNMGFMILNNTIAWNAPFNAVKAADMPNNANVNFASGGYSGEYYVIFGADFTGAFNIYNTLQELWVE